jgi:hypothetical protein
LEATPEKASATGATFVAPIDGGIDLTTAEGSANVPNSNVGGVTVDAVGKFARGVTVGDVVGIGPIDNVGVVK